MMPEIPLLCTFIAIIACIYASYTDLKSGIIQNKLTFPLIGIGIVLNAFYAFTTGNIWLIVYALILTAGIFVFGYLLWKMGAWAGGDVKLFTALAALLPFYPGIVNYSILGIQFPINATYPFPLTIIINSILAILPFLLIFIFYIVLRKKKYLMDELTKPIRNYRKNIVLTLVITPAVTLAIIITPYLPLQRILVFLILIYLLTLTISKLPNMVKAAVVSVLTVYALYNNIYLTLSSVVVLFIIINVTEVIKALLLKVNRKALQDNYEIDDLKEGMIPAYNLYQRDDEVYFDKKRLFSKINESIKSADPASISKPKGKILVSNMAAGLSNEDIKLIKELYNENKISNQFKIKKGAPFAPSILISLLISLFIGDLAVMLQQLLYFLFT